MILHCDLLAKNIVTIHPNISNKTFTYAFNHVPQVYLCLQLYLISCGQHYKFQMYFR